MLNRLKKNKGFTLIELMIVVAIIGILAAVAIPKFADLVTKSKEASVKGSLGAIRSATSIYYGDTEGVNPSNLFDALASSSKYMPPVNNVPSLGRYVIPPVPSQNNTGHNGGNYDNACLATAVALTIGDNTPLYYNTGEGVILINCSHKDTRGTVWSSY